MCVCVCEYIYISCICIGIYIYITAHNSFCRREMESGTPSSKFHNEAIFIALLFVFPPAIGKWYGKLGSFVIE